VIPCLAGQYHAVVWGNGDVSSCEMLPAVGNIKDQDFAEVQASEKYRNQVEDIKAGKCYCTHNCAMLPSIFFNPKKLPNLLYQSVKS